MAQTGSAPRSHRGGQGFKSPQVHSVMLQDIGMTLNPQRVRGRFGWGPGGRPVGTVRRCDRCPAQWLIVAGGVDDEFADASHHEGRTLAAAVREPSPLRTSTRRALHCPHTRDYDSAADAVHCQK